MSKRKFLDCLKDNHICMHNVSSDDIWQRNTKTKLMLKGAAEVDDDSKEIGRRKREKNCG